MNSWLSASHAADEQPLNSQYSGWSSTANLRNQPSPNRREHAVQPPLLTTALNSSHFQHASTPLSSTSLSSPFTQGQSPAVSSPANGRSASSSSSMASRQYSVPYNPQDWGPVGGAPAQTAYSQPNNVHRTAPQRRGPPEEPISPPPPPYSPPHNQNRLPQDSYGQASSNLAITPNVMPAQSHQSYRTSEFDNTADYHRRSLPRPRPVSMLYGSEAELHRQSLPPPPPPQGNSGSRSNSQNRLNPYQGSPFNSASSHSQSRISMSSYEQPLPSPALRSDATAGPYVGQLEAPTRPPASRRAASAGAVVSSASSSRPSSLSRGPSPSSGWEPGMPLPPPPPGPPPAGRSVSVSGSSESSSARTTQGPGRTRARPPPLMGTGLGSIPPTPADWVDEEYINHETGRDKEPLYIDTNRAMRTPDLVDNLDSNDQLQLSQKTPGSGGSGLFRSPAIRDPSAKGIRERRIERRNRQSQVFEDMSAVSSTSGNPWADALENIVPSNLVLPEPKSSPDHTRQTSSKFTPQSTRSIGSDGQHTTSRSRASSGGLFSDRSSSYSTPKPEQSPVVPSAALANTPPFSPNGDSSSRYHKAAAAQAIPPKALPTPPLNSAKDPLSRSRAPSRGAEARPISHILHLPNDGISTIKPLSPRRLPTQETAHQISLDSLIKEDKEFIQNALQRHKIFIEEEAAAMDEAEGLRLFNEFIIAESQIRRQRYAKVFDSGSPRIEDVRSKLFEIPQSQPTGSSHKAVRPAPTLEIPPSRPSRPDSAWWNNYQPCLSPIASLSMSNDEMSSRGRAPSRWWESKTGSSSEGVERRIQRSKRESKYMGLPREAMQWDQERTPSKLDDADANFTGQQVPYGPNEYPPEKAGWYEKPTDYPVAGNGNRFAQVMASQRLDISRLVTLPPPYPRHYPAVNNSHPDLVSYRTTVRSITDLSEIKATRERYKADMERMSQEYQHQVKDDRRQFKANIQSQIQEGSLTFAEAAEAEAAMLVEENKRERELAKRQLDSYQEAVLKPMHAILADRISRATTCIDELSSRLFDDAQRETPDQTQEEGDEKPELLEKLTQLKWLFEAREQLHRETFDLVSDRDQKYKSIALLPYQQSKNNDKLRETQAFFSKDALDRRVQYETTALTRLESFLDVIEQNVVRGVEVQLSAFWDIAPSLLALVQQVPESLHGFQVQIPSNEYEENPSYHAHPLQYLYSLLSHAEKSSYQYIESQTNLLCLLHEVRSAVMRASRNLAEAERIWQGESEDTVHREMQEARADEELTLTTDLKDKVATVEGQWAEALGSQIQEVRERVKDQLVIEGGWEDLEQLEQE
ncbi:uncharacterized protein N7482_003915 [Penicillium canariense]|uniref:Uncharacterized protein n=1 Tax=Penicillium canariense TaxID=189055 RepID=A0A9W9I5M0_9EURO|nr:uncharacterized protein N7482_003915 [Penicillium canariense]KAJ5168321.1 hypothetical protein N7482_003915 [Penicillium canariense]